MAGDTFECTMCGDCCRGFSDDYCVLVSREDIDRMSAHLGMDRQAFVTAYCVDMVVDGFRVRRLAFDRSGACLLLDGNRCGINAAKPLQCALGPFGPLWDGERRYDCMQGDFDIDKLTGNIEDVFGNYFEDGAQ